jgi:predicted ribosome-associated RNA-binding protein Tma20
MPTTKNAALADTQAAIVIEDPSYVWLRLQQLMAETSRKSAQTVRYLNTIARATRYGMIDEGAWFQLSQ